MSDSFTWTYDVEERADGVYLRFEGEAEWVGPFTSREAAEKVAYDTLNQLMAEIGQTIIGV